MKNLLFIVPCLIAISCGNTSSNVSAPATPHLQDTTLTNKSTDTVGKIDFESIKRYQPGAKGEWYNAIIRPINPSKDDYKGYCKYIVREILKTANDKNLTIIIYDDKKACTLYESINDGVLLSKKDYKYSSDHVIASYIGQSPFPDEPSYDLEYFMDNESVAKKYHSHETYKP